ncbi:transposase [Microcoleus sp. MON2_D5]|uniref:transposase n=1 Tax=Microcoleus sp. MON2_D5 TaxID=2818833 RepID=UPI002FD01BF0
MALVTFTGRSVKLKDGMLRFPLGSKVKTWFGLDAFFLPMPSNLDFKAIREYRILPRNGCFYLELIYKTENIRSNVNPAKCLAIDHGIDNWLTCVSNAGTSFIIDGKHLKSLNQRYNKRVASLRSGKANGYWSKRLASLTEKRNRQMRDAVNKAARKVIQNCLNNQIGTVVFGWNKGQKDSANMGKKTNQKFVQIPTGRLKDRIAQLCEQHGIKFVETEESYSSKASFVDNDFLPTFGEKPEGWKASGKRLKRGLYRTAQGWLINADANGGANIARKVAIMLGLDLSGISRGDLSAPLRLKLWS